MTFSVSFGSSSVTDNRSGWTLLLLGATGLVGGEVLRLALDDPRVSRTVAPTRRPLAPAARLENPVIDFDTLPTGAPWWTADAVVCALGSTIRAAGSQEAFRKVDRDYVIAIARLTRSRGVRAFALTSAIGANAGSRILYNRVKGEVEAGVDACGFPSLTIVRPGFIAGVRQESRPLEYAAVQVVRAVGPLLPRRWRVNPAEHIARALLDAAIRAETGRYIVTSEALV
jgi:uncharacterized protein YbjT (DUF2867 family)